MQSLRVQHKPPSTRRQLVGKHLLHGLFQSGVPDIIDNQESFFAFLRNQGDKQ